MLPWVIFAVMLFAAAASVAADGLVTSLTAGPADDVRREWLVRDRERVHRSLSSARLVCFLCAGAAAPPLWHADGPQVLAAIMMLLLVVGAAETLARTIGATRADGPSAWLSGWAAFVTLLATPVVAVMERTEKVLASFFPQAKVNADADDVASEQFLDIVAAEADVTGKEKTLLEGAFALGETQVQEIMTPRVELIAIERDTPWSEVIDRFRSSAHSRLPVYKDRIDDVIGVLYVKDLLADILDGEEPEQGWISRMRPGFYIPPTKPIDALLREFRSQRTHIAIVMDEYGGTAGLVTIEDILEEVVGEIDDEHDLEDERQFESRDDREFWVTGRITLDELSETLGVDIESDEVGTVGGLIMERLGRVPRAGEQLQIAGFRVVVEQVRRRQVLRVYFERLDGLPERSMPVDD
ncbi:MAG TPA: hemolysin family protein [Gemmatimonadaceae bacterium]|nr:hemolysin family protein [Gemmatimonadaceae bacterium]